MSAWKWIAGAVGIAGASYGARVAATWLRYGHARPSTDPLIDRFMPRYDVRERHAIDVDAPPAVTMAAAREIPMDRSRIVRAIFRARELLMRVPVSGAAARTPGLVEATTAMGWGVLRETPGELVMGAVTKPWEAEPTLRALPPDDFAAFDEPDHVKIVWTLRADPIYGGSQLSSETRAVATDANARAKFRLYWSLLSPGISLIRWAHLPHVKAEAERRAQTLPGDDIVPDPRAEMTHSIDIDALPQDVWPWLVQMGCRRGGWYSWDVLDNGGERSAETIVPELQHLAVGDVLPYRPVGDEGFEVLRIEPGRALVLGSTAPAFHGTWAFVLEPLDEGTRTRLVTRYRAAFEPTARRTAFVAAMRAVHAFMERKQLRTIKHHAERVAGRN